MTKLMLTIAALMFVATNAMADNHDKGEKKDAAAPAAKEEKKAAKKGGKKKAEKPADKPADAK